MRNRNPVLATSAFFIEFLCPIQFVAFGLFPAFKPFAAPFFVGPPGISMRVENGNSTERFSCIDSLQDMCMDRYRFHLITQGLPPHRFLGSQAIQLIAETCPLSVRRI